MIRKFKYNNKLKINPLTWACVHYDIKEDYSSFEFRVKQKTWIKNNLHYHPKNLNIEELRLHLLLHELDHIATTNFSVRPKNFDEAQAEEVKAWVYAGKCVKNQQSIINTILLTSDNYDLADSVGILLGVIE